MSKVDWFSQSPHRVRMDWGGRGCIAAAARGDAVVVVDVLRFSTAVCAANARGVKIYPATDREDLSAMVKQYDARVFENALAPGSYETLSAGERIVLQSPNGGTCVRLASAAPAVMVGALVNASAVPRCVQWILENTELSVSVIACGERWREPDDDDGDGDGALRFAIEDYLGAGAILSSCDGDLSAEARACAGAFRAARTDLLSLLLGCGSGREQIDKDDRVSVEHAAQIDRYDIVPVLRGSCLEPLAVIASLVRNDA